MNGRVVRDAIQEEKLVKTEAQEGLQDRFLRAALGLASDEPIEGGPPAGDPVDQFLDQGPVGRGQRGASQGLLENGFQPVRRPGLTLEEAHGNFSWFFDTHGVIMPVVQLQSSF